MVRVRLRRPEHRWWMRTLLAGYEWAASLEAAVVLIGLSAAVLGWATFVEKWYGTEAVGFGIYRSWWFMGLVGLIGVNVLCATLIRWPWKKHQTGFVITHTGILVLLVGCLVQQGWGIQGQMVLQEGEASNLVYEDAKFFRLEISEPRGSEGHLGHRVVRTVEVPFRSGPFSWGDYARLPMFPWRLVGVDRGVLYDREGIRLEVLDYYADSERVGVPRVVLELRRRGESPEAEEVFPGIRRLTLSVAAAPGPHGREVPFGVGDRQNMPWGPPVAFWLAGSQDECQAFLAARPEEPLGPLGQVVLWHQGKVYRFSVEALHKRQAEPLGASGLKVRLLQYESRFRAVELEVSGQEDGGREVTDRLLLFAQNPSHDRQGKTLGVYGSYWVEPPPVPPRLAGIERVEHLRLAATLRLDILAGPDGRLYYRQWQAPRVASGGWWPGLDRQPLPAQAEAAGSPGPPGEGQPGWDGPVPVPEAASLRVFEGTGLETEVRLIEFWPASRPMWVYQPKPLDSRSGGPIRQPRAKGRLSVQEGFSSDQGEEGSGGSGSGVSSGGNTGEFWIPLGGPQQPGEEAVVSCGQRRVEVRLEYRTWRLGIQIYLRDFTRKVEPGSLHDSHYASLVDVWEGNGVPKVSQENVLITMNQPLTVKDPTTGRTYRFYQASFEYLGKPGDPEFERGRQARSVPWTATEPSGESGSAGESGLSRPVPEDLYRSILSVNYDPGRGLKYAGSLLIVVGISVMYLMRAYIFAPRLGRPSRVVGLVVLWWGALLLGADSVWAEPLDWSQWRRLPVFTGGRMMPLDSFARSVVEQICGRTRPRFSLVEALPGEDLQSPDYAEAKKLFPQGESPTWEPYELIFSWLVEPQRWERTPFLVGQHHQLREEILGLPRETRSGQPIRYVSPWQVEHAAGFWRWLDQLAARRQAAAEKGEKFQPTGVDRKAWQLLEAYQAWRELTFSAQSLAGPQSLFSSRLAELRQIWQATDQAIERALAIGGGPRQAFQQFPEAMEALENALRHRPIDRRRMETEAHRLRQAAQHLADWFAQDPVRFRRGAPPMPPEARSEMEGHWAALVSRSRDLLRLAWEVQSALFDNTPVSGGGGGPLRVVPSLNPFALEETRTPEENPQPWLPLQALLEASLTETLAEYPTQQIQAVREAWSQVAQAYQDRQASDRAERFAQGMEKLSHALRHLGEAIHQKRQTLPVRKWDFQALQATQYPPPGAMDLEVYYNQIDPFRAAWIAYLGAAVGFALAFGRMRKPMFWLGMVLLAVAQGFILYGLGLRYAITGWVPVTNMFETVVFVALTVAAMGGLLALWPLMGPGLKIAWQATAWPIRWQKPLDSEPPSPAEAKPSLSDPQPGGPEDWPPAESAAPPSEPACFSCRPMHMAQWFWTPFRLVLMGVIFYGLTQVHYGQEEGYTVISLLPRVERGGSLTANDLAAWVTGWAFLLGAMWYGPRAILALWGSLLTMPMVWLREGAREAGRQVLERKAYAFSGAIMGLIGALLAYYAPPTVLDKTIAPLRPVLRDNFWLTAHVLTITASYGAGALALALGNLALFHYLFGRYRPAPASSSADGGPEAISLREARRQEPALCPTLAHYIYRAMQSAVLLLAAGTLLGALWADVAWGRFWGWDAKEVWALISLLVYMVVLHGRYIGWFGNFGLAAFSVFGATAILMAWYGVNYVLDVGLHSYGRGTGGLKVVLAFVGANWLFLTAAALRYWRETRIPNPSS